MPVLAASDRGPRFDSQVDEQGHVNAHVACTACGYDLHTLAATERGPECHLPIEETLRATSDTPWLSNVKSGIQSMLVGHYFILGSLLLWPFALLGFCFAMLLQVGSAIDLATRHPDDFCPPTRRRWLILLIAIGALAYVVGGILMAVGFSAGLMLVTLAGSLHATGIALAWSRVEMVMQRGVSSRLATAARVLKYLTVTMAGSMAALSAYTWIMRSAASGPRVAPPVLLMLIASAMAWLFASLAVLHLSGRAARKSLAAVHLRG